jgi:hypothetical protein
MTFMDTRAALATALSTVAGVTGYTHRPMTFKAGDAWPLFQQADRGPGQAWGATWKVYVILGSGGDEKATSDLSEDILPELVDELSPVAYVETPVPAIEFPTSAGALIALELTCVSE